MRRGWIAGSLALIVAACGGGGLTLEEFATEAEDLVAAVTKRIDALDANWESQKPTIEGARTYWDRRMEARVDFLEGLEALDPPEEAVDLHRTVVELVTKFTAAEEAVGARVDTFETVTEHWEWWDTPEGQAARAMDEEATAICNTVQAEFDGTEASEGFGIGSWITPEVREAIRVALGCS